MKAVYGLSGDPITNGHLWVIRTAAELFGNLDVVIANSPQKKYLFSLDERVQMAKDIIDESKLGNDYSAAQAHIAINTIKNEYLAIYAMNKGIKYLVRGLRNERDFTYEREMSHVNSELAPECQTVFLIPPKNLDGVSSSFVKNMIGPDGWKDFIHPSVPQTTYNALLKKFA